MNAWAVCDIDSDGFPHPVQVWFSHSASLAEAKKRGGGAVALPCTVIMGHSKQEAQE